MTQSVIVPPPSVSPRALLGTLAGPRVRECSWFRSWFPQSLPQPTQFPGVSRGPYFRRTCLRNLPRPSLREEGWGLSVGEGEEGVDGKGRGGRGPGRDPCVAPTGDRRPLPQMSLFSVNFQRDGSETPVLTENVDVLLPRGHLPLRSPRWGRRREEGEGGPTKS